MVMMEMGLKVLTTRDVKKDTPELARYVDSGQLVYRPFGERRPLGQPSLSRTVPARFADQEAAHVPPTTQTRCHCTSHGSCDSTAGFATKVPERILLGLVIAGRLMDWDTL